MSGGMLHEDVLFFQRLLKAEGLYNGKLDGIWGPLTEAASNEFEEKSKQIKEEIASFDSRTEAHIRTLLLKAQREARVFMKKVLDAGINAKIISGTRTYAEQNNLFRQGRFGNPGPVVTKARGGRSNHNFGIAWDIGIFTTTGGFITLDKAYDKPAEVGLSETLEWGGNWRSFVDKPHYQLKVGEKITIVRARFEAGENFVMVA
jgi:peptidoglycan L-alanyl-D-glutamate endopeptidase CwlK